MRTEVFFCDFLKSKRRTKEVCLSLYYKNKINRICLKKKHFMSISLNFQKIPKKHPSTSSNALARIRIRTMQQEYITIYKSRQEYDMTQEFDARKSLDIRQLDIRWIKIFSGFRLYVQNRQKRPKAKNWERNLPNDWLKCFWSVIFLQIVIHSWIHKQIRSECKKVIWSL